MEILACPIDKYYPLELHVFEEKEEIVEGMIICPNAYAGILFGMKSQRCCQTNYGQKKTNYHSCKNGKKRFLKKYS